MVDGEVEEEMQLNASENEEKVCWLGSNINKHKASAVTREIISLLFTICSICLLRYLN